MTYTIGDNTNNLTVPYANSAGNADTVDGLHFYGGSRGPFNFAIASKVIVKTIPSNDCWVALTPWGSHPAYLQLGIDQNYYCTVHRVYWNNYTWSNNYFIHIDNCTGYGTQRIPEYVVAQTSDGKDQKLLCRFYGASGGTAYFFQHIDALDIQVDVNIDDYTIVSRYKPVSHEWGGQRPIGCSYLRMGDETLNETELAKLKQLIN